MSYIARGAYPAGTSALTFDDGLVRRHERLAQAKGCPVIAGRRPQVAGRYAFRWLAEDELNVLVHAEPQDSDQLADVFDPPSEDGVAVIRLMLVEKCFQPGQHGRALSRREVGASSSGWLSSGASVVETLHH
ncbi:hypothetical protein [Streptomyces massasporeus]|uniref:hypothetical protein n=1 Tax=Streptomyces massasporeus TaxID=67324 RepID=UPI0036CDA005